MENWVKYTYTAILCLNHMAYVRFPNNLTDAKVIIAGHEYDSDQSGADGIGGHSADISAVYDNVHHIHFDRIPHRLFLSVHSKKTYLSVCSLIDCNTLSVCFLLKYLNRQLVWIAFLVMMSITLTLVPHSSGLVALYACATVMGLGCGVLNTVMPVWIIEMWKDRSPAVLQIPGLTFGIGTILSPLIIRPFLRERYTVSLNETDSGPEPWVYNQEYEEWRRSLLFTPFIILGSIQLFCELSATVVELN